MTSYTQFANLANDLVTMLNKLSAVLSTLRLNQHEWFTVWHAHFKEASDYFFQLNFH